MSLWRALLSSAEGLPHRQQPDLQLPRPLRLLPARRRPGDLSRNLSLCFSYLAAERRWTAAVGAEAMMKWERKRQLIVA